jgi:hypothetical protein
VQITPGYVIASTGSVLVIVPARNSHGFLIRDDVRSWPGGVGLTSWRSINADDPALTQEIREQLEWIIDQAEQLGINGIPSP